MKKTLVAIAALTAVSAFAQSSVTIYGKADVSYGSDKTTVSNDATKDVTSTALKDNAIDSGRIGFRGVEDLGSGLRAGFIMESGVDMTGGPVFAKQASGSTNTGNAASGISSNNNRSLFGGATRQALVSLGSNSLGELSIGYKKQAELDAFETNAQNTGNSAGGTAAKDSRLDRANGLYYKSPTMSGIYATVQYTAGKVGYEQAATAATSDYSVNVTSLTLNYAQGPVSAVAHTGSGKVKMGSSVNPANAIDGSLKDGALPTTTAIFKVGGDNKYDTQIIGAAYDFGVAKINALSGSRKTGLSTDATYQDVKYTNMGVSAPVGNWLITAATEKRTTDKNGGVREDEMKSNQLIARYNFSKRTHAYGLYGSDKTDKAGVITKLTSTRVGIVTNF
jgi:predicted porin